LLVLLILFGSTAATGQVVEIVPPDPTASYAARVGDDEVYDDGAGTHHVANDAGEANVFVDPSIALVSTEASATFNPDMTVDNYASGSLHYEYYVIASNEIAASALRAALAYDPVHLAGTANLSVTGAGISKVNLDTMNNSFQATCGDGGTDCGALHFTLDTTLQQIAPTCDAIPPAVCEYLPLEYSFGGYIDLSAIASAYDYYDANSAFATIDPIISLNTDLLGVSADQFEIRLAPSIGEPTGGVPEPATWVIMLGGYGLIGGTLRRRRTTSRFGASDRPGDMCWPSFG